MSAPVSGIAFRASRKLTSPIGRLTANSHGQCAIARISEATVGADREARAHDERVEPDAATEPFDGIDRTDQRDVGRHDGRGAEALDHARHDQARQRPGDRAEQRRDREQGDAGKMHAALPEALAERRERKQRRHQPELVGVDDPHGRVGRHAEIDRDRRQRRVRDRRIERRERDGAQHRGHRACALRLGKTVGWGGCCHRSVASRTSGRPVGDDSRTGSRDRGWSESTEEQHDSERVSPMRSMRKGRPPASDRRSRSSRVKVPPRRVTAPPGRTPGRSGPSLPQEHRIMKNRTQSSRRHAAGSRHAGRHRAPRHSLLRGHAGPGRGRPARGVRDVGASRLRVHVLVQRMARARDHAGHLQPSQGEGHRRSAVPRHRHACVIRTGVRERD